MPPLPLPGNNALTCFEGNVEPGRNTAIDSLDVDVIRKGNRPERIQRHVAGSNHVAGNFSEPQSW